MHNFFSILKFHHFSQILKYLQILKFHHFWSNFEISSFSVKFWNFFIFCQNLKFHHFWLSFMFLCLFVSFIWQILKKFEKSYENYVALVFAWVLCLWQILKNLEKSYENQTATLMHILLSAIYTFLCMHRCKNFFFNFDISSF